MPNEGDCELGIVTPQRVYRLEQLHLLHAIGRENSDQNLRVLASSVSSGLEGTSPLTIQLVSLSLPCACAWPLPSLLKWIAPFLGARRLPCLRACRPCVTERG
jgi:hypothetical protein